MTEPMVETIQYLINFKRTALQSLLVSYLTGTIHWVWIATELQLRAPCTIPDDCAPLEGSLRAHQ